MPFPPALQWFFLATGVLCVVGGLRRWRQGGRSQALVGVILLIQLGSTSANVWLRYPAIALLSVAGVWVLLKSFQERDRVSLWICLPFFVMALVITTTELFFDDLNWWQAASFTALGLLSAAALGTIIVRLARRRVAPPALVTPAAIL